jgi:predicted ABC-type ATPase
MEPPRPLLTVFAGPNGSGKSSLTRHLQAAGYDFGEYINPDDIAVTLVGSYLSRVREAQAVADARRADAIAAKRSFSFETVFSHPSKLVVLDEARRSGFEVTLFFIGVDDPIVNIERVKARVELGGHDVPEDRIVARYHRTMRMLPEMLKRVDRAWIFDNTIKTSLPGFPGRLTVSITRNGQQLVVSPRYPLPRWVAENVIGPLVPPLAVVVE